MDVFTAFLEGMVMAIWPICLVIIAAIFVYNLVVHTKYMEVIKQILTSVSRDKRILVLIISWGFGAFMEGMAGFGTAVVILAGILVALGFEPLFAAVVCLVANTTLLRNLARLDKLLKLGGVKGLAFHQGRGDKVELIAVVYDDLAAGLIGLVDIAANFLVNFVRDFLRIVALVIQVTTEEHLVLGSLTVRNRSEHLAHAVLRDHAAHNARGMLYIL